MTALFLQIVDMAITAGFVVLCVLFLRLIWRKAPKWIAVLLWGLVGLRLLVPFSIISPASLMPDLSLPSVSAPAPSPDYIPEQPNEDAPLQNDSPTLTPETIVGQPDEPIDVTVPSVETEVSFVQVASAVWLFGVAAMLWYALMSYVDVWRRVRTATKDENGLYRSEAVGSPFILGLFRPRIYAPYHLEGESLDAVFAHERAHIKRGDHIIKPLAFLLLSVYWFHPLLWVAYILLCRDIELACDERVVKELDDNARRTYSTALVASAVGRRRVAACPLAFGEVAVKERVKSVMRYRKPAIALVVCALVMVMIASVTLLTDPAKEPPVTFEGATLDAVIGDMVVKKVELSGDEETPSFVLSNSQCGVFGFAVKEIDPQKLTVTVCTDREIEYNGKMTKEIVVPYDETAVLYPLSDNRDLRFRLTLKFAQAVEDYMDFAEVGDIARVERYFGGDTALYLYEHHFHLSVNGDAIATAWNRPLYYNWGTSNWVGEYTPSLPVDGIAEGTYEWVDDNTLYLTENGGLSQYVFVKDKDGVLKYQKAQSSHHKLAHSPVLPARLTLTPEYRLRMECMEQRHMAYTLSNALGEPVHTGESEGWNIEVYSYGDGVVRVVHSSRIGHEEHRLYDLNGGGEMGTCVYATSTKNSINPGYYPTVCEKDGKVIVKAQYSSWCMTAPPDNALYELEGLTSLRKGAVKAVVDGDEITIWYTDDGGNPHVIAETLRSVKDGKGTPITRPLIAVTEVDENDQPTVDSKDVFTSESGTLTYHQINTAYAWIDGAYVDVARAFEDGTLDAAKMLAFAEKALEEGHVSAKKEENGSVLYTFANADSYHSMMFVPREDGTYRTEPAYDVHIGFIPNKLKIKISEPRYLFYSPSE